MKPQVLLPEQVPGSASCVATSVGPVHLEGGFPQGPQGARGVPAAGDVY